MSKSGYPEKAPVVGRSVADAYKDIDQRSRAVLVDDSVMMTGAELEGPLGKAKSAQVAPYFPHTEESWRKMIEAVCSIGK